MTSQVEQDTDAKFLLYRGPNLEPQRLKQAVPHDGGVSQVCGVTETRAFGGIFIAYLKMIYCSYSVCAPNCTDDPLPHP